ncbi:MAG: apolipoprotein N-acyltransferase [Novosphingobium sp.]|nr:apolipoprotein N-acyltransferase [Novosphingobium sp.]
MAAVPRLLSQAGVRMAAHPYLAAPLLGAGAACGFRPLALWPLSLLGLAGLTALVWRAPSWKHAAATGWLWGVGHFCLGDNWIATAFTYQAQMPAWLGWIAVFLLSLYLAVFPALAALGAWLIARGSTRAFVLAFAGCWIVAEWLRSWVLTGFAWNPLAVATLGPFGSPGFAAVAPWLGTYALSGVVVLLAGCWFTAVSRRKADWRAAVLALGPAALFVLPNVPPHQAAGSLPFTLVQPNIPQRDLDNPATFERQFANLAALTMPHRPGERRLVLWPESGVPDYLREGYPLAFYEQTTFDADPRAARARIAQAIGPGSLLLTGAVDLELAGDAVVGARNVVTALADSGAIRAGYAKAHLVPYGEYLPMRPLLQPLGLTRLVAGTIDFRAGPGPRTLDLGPWGKAGVQICYEIVFSGQIVDRNHRPDYIFNPSNDGWFGAWGPPQHLAQARLRAIEEGLPILRATTTGISAVIDADGIVRQALPRNTAGRLDGVVPPAHPATLFARLGNVLPLAWAVVLLVLSLVALRRARR